MKNYLYSENGIRFTEASERKIVDLVLRNVLEPDSVIQDVETQQWRKIREFDTLMKKILEPDINLKFSEPNIDMYLDSGRETLYYNVSKWHYIFLMLISGGLFLVYWMYRNWSYINRKTKYKRSIWFTIIDLISFNSLFYLISNDTEMLEKQKPSFDPDRTARSLYILIAISFVFGYAVSSFIWLSSLFSIGILLSIIFVTMPVRNFIQDVNDSLGNSYSSQTIFYYFIIIYSLFLVFYMLFVYGISMLNIIPGNL